MKPTNTRSNKPTSPTTMEPTNPCSDVYAYCSLIATNGYCYSGDLPTRSEVRQLCPLSCATCFNGTIGPTYMPSISPTLEAVPPTYTPSHSPTQDPTETPTQTPVTSKGPTRSPSNVPTIYPVMSPTCADFLDYCEIISSFCNSIDAATKMKMSQDCASTCGLCSMAPTAAPSQQCVDKYAYCEYGTGNGACHNQDNEARMQFINDCPASCGTCHGSSMSPTYVPSIRPTRLPTFYPTQQPSGNPSKEPSMYPTSEPTVVPTCVDQVDYCLLIKDFCGSLDSVIRSQIENNCALTCGLCTREPTISPTATCVDEFDRCAQLAYEGGCFNSDHEAQNDFRRDCPVSCYTCYDNTYAPSNQPTHSPTSAPTCVDLVGYCYLLLPYCNSVSPQSKVQSDCALTCGFCKEQV